MSLSCTLRFFLLTQWCCTEACSRYLRTSSLKVVRQGKRDLSDSRQPSWAITRHETHFRRLPKVRERGGGGESMVVRSARQQKKSRQWPKNKPISKDMTVLLKKPMIVERERQRCSSTPQISIPSKTCKKKLSFGA